MSNPLVRLLKEPLIQFIFLGAAIYGAYALFGAPEGDYRDTTIIVDSNRIESMIGEWERRWNRPPTQQEMDSMIQQFIKEDVLYRQAVAMGLNEDDPITRRRMAQKLEFLTSDLSAMQEPEEGELELFFEENSATYRDPDTISFLHLFVDPDARGDATLDDAEALLEQLKDEGEPGEGVSELGDRFMLQSYFGGATQLEISRQLGTGFAESVMELETDQWSGPVLSGYGVHLVYVYDHVVAPPPTFELVKQRVVEDWLVGKREQFNEDFLEALKGRYEIVIDEIPADRLLKQQTEEIREDVSRVEDAGAVDPVS